MAIRAAENKKHIYVEKGLCRALAEAKAIRKAVRDNKVSVESYFKERKVKWDPMSEQIV